MRIKIFLIVLILCNIGFSAHADEKTYDLIFKKGTLSDISHESVLAYKKDVRIKDVEEDSKFKSGEIKLTFAPQDMADLTFFKDEKSRKIGEFPATVGNPLILYFVESVVLDMAKYAGGSPFYIRNRLKDSLLQEVPILDETVEYEGKDIPVKRIVLKPFEGDENRSKMKGFENLTLTFTMSPKVPGWYVSLAANTLPANSESEVYSNILSLQPMGQVQ